MKKKPLPVKSKHPKGKTVVEYLPDADEIERSPIPRFARFTLHMLVMAVVIFLEIGRAS
jgi:HlyD family secretion protein